MKKTIEAYVKINHGQKKPGKDPKVTPRFRCLMCGNLAWASQLNPDNIKEMEMIAQMTNGFKNISYVTVPNPEAYLGKVRLAMIKKCFKILKKLNTSDLEILKEMGIDITSLQQRTLTNDVKITPYQLIPKITAQLKANNFKGEIHVDKLRYNI
jgi:hypothetical protein